MKIEEFFNTLLGDIVISAIIIIITVIIDKTITKFIKKTIKKRNNKNLSTILIFVSKLKSFAIYTFGILIALYRYETFQDISVALLSALGIGATVLSLSLKESLNNFIAGFEIILNKPFEVGDFLVLPEKNISGTVEEISMRHTILRTYNNQKEILPNKTLNALIVENHNKNINELRLSNVYTIPNEKNIEKVITAIKEEIIKICDLPENEVNNKIEYPKVDVIEFDQNVTKIKAWVVAHKLNDAYDKLYLLNLNVKKRIEKIK